MSLLTGSSEIQVLLESLSSLDVDCVFGCDDLGGMSLLQPSLKGSKIRYFQLQHEQAAVHAADGFARATGKPGVVMLSTPAGITNGITGIATAYSDSVPLVVIAGPLLASPINSEAFQEINISGITMPITKDYIKTNDMHSFRAVIQYAISVAADGRPGPVLIEYTADTTTTNIDEASWIHHITQTKGNKQSIDTSIKLAKEYIETARKPVLFIGGGIIASGAAENLREIVQQLHIPVVSSMMGIGAMNEEDPLYLGMLGMHGTFAANKAVHHCDLLISIGVRFSDRVTGKISGFSPKSKKIHVDIDPAEINKIIEVDLPIVSDAKEFLIQLTDQLDSHLIAGNIENWTNEAIHWKRTVPHFDTSTSLLNPQTIIHLLNDFSDKETIVVTDVGQHQIWTALHYTFTNPRTLLTSGGLGTMGYGLPAAIGAAAAFPGKPIICVSGDGSFQMNLQEMMTIVKYQLPIKIAIMNNGYLGMVRQWQELIYNRRYSEVKITSPRFAQLAQSFGVEGNSAHSEDQAKKLIEAAFDHNGPFLMEFNIAEEENVYPMVPPNYSNHQTILSR